MTALALRDLADIDVGRLRGVGDKKRSSLALLGVENLLDLVTFYPRRWVDRSNEARIADLVPGTEALVLVTVRSVTKRTTRNRRTMVTVNVGDGSGRMEVVFFNQPWRERQLREGLQIAVVRQGRRVPGWAPDVEPRRRPDRRPDRPDRADLPAEREGADQHLGDRRVGGGGAATVSRTRGSPIRCRTTSATVSGCSVATTPWAASTSPSRSPRRRRLGDAWRSTNSCGSSWCWCCASGPWSASSAGLVHAVDGELVRRFYDALPYDLTGAVRRAIAEIEADLAAPHPMHRLLQGDVGSGKTVVAVATMLAAVQGGHQAG